MITRSAHNTETFSATRTVEKQSIDVARSTTVKESDSGEVYLSHTLQSAGQSLDVHTPADSGTGKSIFL